MPDVLDAQETWMKLSNHSKDSFGDVTHGVRSGLTQKLTNAGAKIVDREAEVRRPSGVVCSDLVRRTFRVSFSTHETTFFSKPFVCPEASRKQIKFRVTKTRLPSTVPTSLI